MITWSNPTFGPFQTIQNPAFGQVQTNEGGPKARFVEFMIT